MQNVTWQLTALIMAHGMATGASAQTTPPPATNPASTNAPAATLTSTNAPAKLPEVVVQGQFESYKPDAVSLSKLTEPLRDTPHSVTVVPRQVLDDQGVTTLRDALRNVAGISIAAGEGGSQGDNLTLRGFTARNDIFLDGMRDFGSYYRDPFNWEEVEVLKGPESVMFGRGSTGGVVNQESKMPSLTPAIGGSLSLGTDLTRRGTADINEPLPELGKGAAFRLTLMGHEANVAGRDVTKTSRFGLAPSLTLGLGTPTRLTFAYFHQSADDIPDYGMPWLFNQPARPDRNNFYGFQSDFLRTDADVGTIKLEHDFTDTISVRDQVRYANYRRDFRITEPQATATIAGPAPTPATPLSLILVNRNELAGDSVETMLLNQVDVTAKFETGFINHTVVTGIEGGRETSAPTRYKYTGVPATSLLAPDENQQFAGAATASSQVKTTATSVGLYAVDSLKLGDHWEVAGGFRWDYFDSSYRQTVAPASAFDRVDKMPSWRAALVYKPLSIGSVYFAYGTSFNPSAETLALSAGNANLPPEKNETFEFGTKWDLRDERLSLRGALFRTEKTNARETDPTNSSLITLSGDQQVQGFEIESSGRVTERWRVFATYAFLDSRVVNSAVFPASVGYPLANVPKHTLSLWNTCELPGHFEIGGGLKYVGSRDASSTVPLDPATGQIKRAPGYWTMDAMVKYQVTKRIDLQVNIYNLTDNYYFDQIHPVHVVPGAGRSALFTANFRF